MFTGIIEETGVVEAIRRNAAGIELTLRAKLCARGLKIGDSLAVNGICLTVTAVAGRRVRADVSAETRRVTTVATWRAGDPVHLEPALRVGDTLGGHFVLGHVDGVGRVARVVRAGGGLAVAVAAPPGILADLLPKGSIAVDGVSLTLDQGPFEESFTVTLVPHTLAETRFAALRAGDLVNLEVDVLAKAARGRVDREHPGTSRRAGALTIEEVAARGWTPRAPRHS